MSLDEVAKFYGWSKLRTGFHFLYKYVLELIANICPIQKLRPRLHKLRGVNIGKGVYVGRNVLFDTVYTNQIYIGENSSIGEGTTIYSHNNIPSDTKLKSIYPTSINPVHIGKGVWIMPKVIIIPGIKIGDESVIGIGSLVTKDIPPRSLAVGVPAKVIRDLGEHEVFQKNEEGVVDQ